MLHTTCISSSDSIPSVAALVPFHNPNFTSQVPLGGFNPNIPSSFDFSNNFSTYQSSDSQSTPFTDNSTRFSSISMPPTGANALSYDVSNMLVNSDDSLAQQLNITSEDSLMDESSLDTMTTPLPHPATGMDPALFPFPHSFPQTNLASDSNFSSSLQDPMFCSSTHLNADLASQSLVDSLYCSDSVSPEVQDILQQFI
jgi:hypothetical protein